MNIINIDKYYYKNRALNRAYDYIYRNAEYGRSIFIKSDLFRYINIWKSLLI